MFPLSCPCLFGVLQCCCFCQQFRGKVSGPRAQPPSTCLVDHVKKFSWLSPRPAPSPSRAMTKKAGSEGLPSSPLGNAFKLRLYCSPLHVLHHSSCTCTQCQIFAGLALTQWLCFPAWPVSSLLPCWVISELCLTLILTWTCCSLSGLPVSRVTHCSALSQCSRLTFPCGADGPRPPFP